MIKVLAGIIEKDGKILIARRKPETNLAGKWEFPGGKLEQGETPEECLYREILENLELKYSLANTTVRASIVMSIFQLNFWFIKHCISQVI